MPAREWAQLKHHGTKEEVDVVRLSWQTYLAELRRRIKEPGFRGIWEKPEEKAMEDEDVKPAGAVTHEED